MTRTGLSKINLVVAAAAVFALLAVAGPLLLRSRESSRARSCRSNLRQIGVALQRYHEAFGELPPAAIWRTDRLESLALHKGRRIDLFTGANWAQMLLPQLDEQELADQFDWSALVADSLNEPPRMTRLAAFVCPSDEFNSTANPYQFWPESPSPTPIHFARGNYAINGGSHCHRELPGTTSKPVGDGTHLVMDLATREFVYAGNGVAGINASFSFEDFANGLATTVAIDEVRAGVHAIDPRGVWALGQIASSITWSHGVSGDAYGPNNQWERSDDVLFGGKLREVVGYDNLMRLEMPCVWYVHVNQQATSRSRHPGGVHVLFADGHARFIRDEVDPSLWHVMHSRETPGEILEKGFAEKLAADYQPDKVVESKPRAADVESTPPKFVENSIGMKFSLIPAGEYTMGVADQGNSAELPRECPPHPVRITSAFYLGVHEITQAQFQAVLGENPSWHVPQRLNDLPSADNFPVEQVTWSRAAEFCKRLSEMAEERAARRRYRLPTEAEWEYACREGRSEPYVWNPQRDPTDQSGDNAGRSPPLPLAPVGSYPANKLGLHDMRGNVWEWTADWFDRDYYARSPIDDPQGPAHGYLKVVRGGDWTFTGEACRINYPMTPPWKASRYIGFRVLCEKHP